MENELDLNPQVVTSVDLMKLAEEGRLSKHAMASFLNPDQRPQYLAACAGIEKHYTEACTAKHDPCLASGCSLEGEVCLNPVLEAGTEYHKACGQAWVTFFRDPEHRADPWRHGEGHR